MTGVFWGLVSSILGAILAFMGKSLIKYNKERKSLKDGIMWIQHDRLLTLCRHYLTEGEIGVEDLENLEGLYNSYKGLGGNGTIKKLYERIQNLRIKDEEE